MNIKVRMKNPWFWVSLGGIILTAMGVSADMFTSWGAVIEQAKALVSNPFMLVSVALAVLGVFVDPTTAGVSDSAQALGYEKPRRSQTK